ncbi:MAG: hypothetical protein RL398_3436 [Planctomycetota bacterium]
MKRLPAFVVLAGLTAFAVGRAAANTWVCDDAFITLRYAENFANGLGLVYNAGERVEGYSNPTWTVLCAVAMRLGLDGVAFSQWLGMLCYGLLIPATWWTGRRLAGDGATFLPLAACGVAAHYHLRDFASCGLETLGFVLLVTLLVGLLARASRGRDFAVACVVAVAAALTRPDGGLVGAVAGAVAVLVSFRQRRLAPALGYALPGLCLFVPFLAWRFLYYGEWLPNTFFAKSAGDPYPGQGWFYVGLFFSVYWVLLPALVALLAMPWLRRGRPSPWLLPWFVGTYLAFVVWVGGDFMLARFVLPVTPLLYLAIELAARRLPTRAGAAVCLAAFGLTLLCAPGPELLRTDDNVRGIADERAQYPAERVDGLRAAGAKMRAALDGTELRVAFSGTQAMLVYEAKVTYALEAVTGLTDHYLAHRDLGERGRIGHEKSVRFERDDDRRYVLEDRKVQLLLFDLPMWTQPFPWLKVRIDGVDATLVRWEPQAMRKLLAAPGVVGTDVEAFLDAYLAELDAKPLAQVQADFGALELVYFRWNDDQARRARFLERLRKR